MNANKTGINNNIRNNSAKDKEQKKIAELKKERDNLDKKGYYVTVPGHRPRTEVFVKKGEKKDSVINRFKNRYEK